MGLVNTIEINSLQPLQTELRQDILDYYRSIFPKLNGNNMPEIWHYNGKFYIQDGHHKLRVRSEHHPIMRVTLFTTENCGVTSEVYSFILENLLSNVDDTKKQGVFSLQDMKIAG